MKELTSEDLLRRLTAEMIELKTSGAGMRLEIAPETAFAVVACVQLALRHPHANLGPAADLVRDFIEYVRAKFEPHAPAIAEAIRRGNEPERDTPRQAEPSTLIEFLATRKEPATPEDILEFLNTHHAPAAVLTCPHCGWSMPAPFEKVDLFICAKCGRTVETT
jgi:hypothetical protein